jgi:hypothetical protein
VIRHLLPALYFLLLGLALWAALRRWYDPLPRWAAALFLALPLALFCQALAGGRVLLPLGVLRLQVPFRQLPPEPGTVYLQRDLVHQIAPWTLEVKRALLAGRWPLWNPRVGAGMPLMADPQSQPLQPLVLLGYPFTVWTAAGVTAALRVHLALVFTFLLLRRQGLGGPAALAGSLAFGLGNFLLLWLGWPIANAAALLPVVLYAVAVCGQRGAGRDFGLLAAAAAALMLAGHPETMLYALGLAGLFLVSVAAPERAAEAGASAVLRAARASVVPRRTGGRSLSAAEPRRGGGWRWRLLSRAGLALAIGGGIAALPLLLAHDYLPTSSRAAALRLFLAPRPLGELWRQLARPDSLALWGRRAGSRLLLTAAPRALGDQFGAYRGDTDFLEDAGGFAGTGTLLAALLAVPAAAAGAPLAAGGRRVRMPQERLMLLVLAASLLLLAQPPGSENLVARLPIVGTTAAHANGRIQVLVGFCLAYLAACQVERWTAGGAGRGSSSAGSGPGTTAPATRRAWPAIAAAALGLAAVLAWGYLGHVDAGAAWRHDWNQLRWMWIQEGFLAAAALVLAALARRARAARPQPAPGGVPEDPEDSQAGVPSAGGSDTAGRDAAGTGAVLRWPARVSWRRWGGWAFCGLVGGELLLHNAGANPSSSAAFAFPVTPPIAFLQRHLPAGGGDRMVGLGTSFPANFPEAYGLADVRVDNPSVPDGYDRVTAGLARADLPVPIFRRPAHPFYDFLGVRYVIARPGVELPFALVFRHDAGWVFERPRPLPRMFLPERAQIDRGEWREWLEGNDDFARRDLVTAGAEVWRRWRAQQPDGSRLALTGVEAERVRGRVHLVEPRLLAASIYQDGGWRVLAGSRRLDGVLVNGIFAGAWLPAGDFDVELIYRPRRLLAGGLLTALAVALGCLCWVPPPALPRSPAVAGGEAPADAILRSQ